LKDNGLTLVKADKGKTLAIPTRKQYKDKMKEFSHNTGRTCTNFGVESHTKIPQNPESV